LISSETFSQWLPIARRGHLINFLSAVQEVTPVTCMWTLRRADLWATSMYLHLIVTGRPVPPPTEYFRRRASFSASAIRGLREVGDVLRERAIYIRHDDSGAHYREILQTLNVPDQVRAEIEASLHDCPRLNRAPGQKATAALLHTAAMSARAGVEISEAPLRELLRGGGFAFANDVPCVLVEVEVREAIHAAALAAAREVGFKPYVEFFGAEEVESNHPVSLDPSVVADDELGMLIGRLEGLRRTP
jgi:hypothetical protein